MLNVIIAIAAAATMQAAPSATPRTLETIAGVEIHRFDVAGQTAKAVEAELKKVKKGQPETLGRLFTWNAKIGLRNATEGTVCTVDTATATLDADVYLPRLTEEAKLPKADLDEWKAYEAKITRDATDNLTFVADRLPAIERSLVGKPCDQAATIWNAGVKALIAEQQAFAKTRR
ncbi:MAG TPA: DUF922 domain-containing protein [Sphingomicrobium sp.]|jgi:predicted secreted Zn-dependent protease